jgi:hypothetical protein
VRAAITAITISLFPEKEMHVPATVGTYLVPSESEEWMAAHQGEP